VRTRLSCLGLALVMLAAGPALAAPDEPSAYGKAAALLGRGPPGQEPPRPGGGPGRAGPTSARPRKTPRRPSRLCSRTSGRLSGSGPRWPCGRSVTRRTGDGGARRGLARSRTGRRREALRAVVQVGPAARPGRPRPPRPACPTPTGETAGLVLRALYQAGDDAGPAARQSPRPQGPRRPPDRVRPPGVDRRRLYQGGPAGPARAPRRR